MSRNCCR